MNNEEKDVIDTVQVAIRIRPLVESETARGCESCLITIPGEPQVQIKDYAFTYNHVFPPEVGQQEFYDVAVGNLVSKLFKGYNVTILAYGQTGSGKTYSMGTCYTGSSGDAHNAGVIPQAVCDIFSFVEQHSYEFDFKVSVSFMELYQEQLYDLLSVKARDKSIIEIREDHRGILLPGLTEEKVTTAEETMSCLVRGSQGRATGATAMNAQSSRSHAIFTILIIQESKIDKNQTTTSKFHLVDLAGSERSKKTKATGNRFKEGVKINQGLLALGNVISALGEGALRGFITFRESKLTRLLQDSLGGNSMTLMVACVSPADYNLEETVSTLRYADRARRIKNKPIVNQDVKAAEIMRLNSLVQQLRLQVLNQGGEVSESGTSLIDELRREKQKNAELSERYEKVLEKNKNLNNMLQQSLAEHTTHFEKALLAEASKDKIERRLAEITEECNQTIDNLDKINDKTDPSIREEALHSMREMRTKIIDLHMEQKQCGKLILQLIHNDQEESKPEEENGTDEGCSPELNESDFEEKQEAHALEQVSRNNQLQDLVKSLALKMSLAEKLSTNNQDLTTYNESVKECEVRINELELEKDKLMQQLKTAQIKTKMDPETVDERRQKIKALESEISNLQRKCQHQANLIKMKEKNESKINILNNEIHQMKAAKVKLIKTMRAENDRFRTWKLKNEQQIVKLSNLDRKRQNDMLRMESKHTKQQNVMKRKMEEAVAINKRLKDALDRQQMAQKRRGQPTAGKSETIIKIEHDLDVLASLAAVECTLAGLMEDRASLTGHMEQLKELNPSDPGLKTLQEDINLRSAQIADMQQKILSSELQSPKQGQKESTRFDTLQSMVDAKATLKYLFDAAAQAKREIQRNIYRNKQDDSKFEELKLIHKDTTNRLTDIEHKLKENGFKHKKELSEIERQYEETVSTLMRQLNGLKAEGNGSGPENELMERIFILQENYENAIQTKASLQEENEQLLKNVIASSNNNRKIMKKKNTKKIANTSLLWDDEEEVLDKDDSHLDPDWSETPISRRNAKTRGTMVPLEESTRVAAKRSVDGQTKCSCKTNCASKLCSCRKLKMGCSSRCKCNHEQCSNKDLSDSENNSHANSTDEYVSMDKDTSNDLSKSNSDNKKNETFNVPTINLEFRDERRKWNGHENGENDPNIPNKKKNRSFFYGDGKADI